MKLLVSDYDGTFKKSVKDLKLNIDAINKFRQRGNKFAIATGREFESISYETVNYGIDYDYLICNNGLIIYDGNNKIIKADELSLEELYFIDNLLKGEKNLQNIKYYDLYSSTLEFKNILEIYAKFYDIKSASEFKEKLQTLNPNLGFHQIGRRLFIGKKLTKASAISFISKKDNIEDIYTIGDDINDLEMLSEFNGYKIFGCNKKLWFKKIPTVKNVHSLVKKINKK